VIHMSVTSTLATIADLSWIDHLHHCFRLELGFLTRTALEQAITSGRVSLARENGQPAGYVLGAPRYHGLDRHAIIYQAAVPLDAQRRHVGRACLEHWLTFVGRFPLQTSLWCAADLLSGLFWAAMGFEPRAWREGSRQRGRIHLFWTSSDPGHQVYVPSATHSGQLSARRPIIPLPDSWTWEEGLPGVTLPKMTPQDRPGSTIAPSPDLEPVSKRPRLAVVLGGRVRFLE
jgi:hypothetical protein